MVVRLCCSWAPPKSVWFWANLITFWLMEAKVTSVRPSTTPTTGFGKSTRMSRTASSAPMYAKLHGCSTCSSWLTVSEQPLCNLLQNSNKWKWGCEVFATLRISYILEREPHIAKSIWGPSSSDTAIDHLQTVVWQWQCNARPYLGTIFTEF